MKLSVQDERVLDPGEELEAPEAHHGRRLRHQNFQNQVDLMSMNDHLHKTETIVERMKAPRHPRMK